MRAVTLSVVAAPLLSRAGVNRARLRMIRQVAVSSAVDPLDDVTVQLVTLPSGPTVRRKPGSRRPKRTTRDSLEHARAQPSAAAAAEPEGREARAARSA